MIPELEIPLSFDGNQWIAALGENSIQAPELNQLQDAISKAVRQMPCYATHTAVPVWLMFDYDALPAWFRQYHTHYFNYRLTVSMMQDGETEAASG